MATNDKRLIEVAFPLKQTSLDSVHEKTVRHGHISTLHIWPARRPLAASRAALIATLLHDPGSKKERDDIIERLGGRVVDVVKKKKLPSGTIEEKLNSETLGGILHWGRESNPDIEWFRGRIRDIYGRPPRVADPFSGGGAIPLEAMRLGCEATALDINPVAWFVLKCTLDYPRRVAGQHSQLPSFALEAPDFMEQFFKGTAKLTKKQMERNLAAVQRRLFPAPDVDYSWHARAWGWWVLQRAKKTLQHYYPEVDGKPTVAYLWARTVKCKSCRALFPLLKTRWLCKKDKKRVLLSLEPKSDETGVTFSVLADIPQSGGNVAQRREHDKRIGAGTMFRSGALCPCCKNTVTTMDEIRAEGIAGRIGATLTAVVVDGADGKEYRLPTEEERALVEDINAELEKVYAKIPFGIPEEPTPGPAGRGRNSSSLRIYGLNTWKNLFTDRQLLAIGTFLLCTRDAYKELLATGYSIAQSQAIAGFLGCMLDRLINQGSTISRWNQGGEKVEGTFSRFALPFLWDFAEVNPLSQTSGAYQSAIDWVSLVVAHLMRATSASPDANVLRGSAIDTPMSDMDVIITDPPYYDAIIYADIMDYFYVWLRRLYSDLIPELADAFVDELSPKWDKGANNGELIDDPSRHGDNFSVSEETYENGMYRAFLNARHALGPNGRFVVVFANKHPQAWSSLVSAVIRAGFVVDGSWPIQTEMSTRTRARASAALASSVWLVCRKRPENSCPGWDNLVLTEMRERIQEKLRAFWDAGLRGPDFVWAATGPALEVYSQHPAIRKANQPGALLEVDEFLKQVRRIVVDFVVGQVLTHASGSETITGLDDITTYYVLHRYDFGFDEAPSGAAILYAISCGLTDRELTDRYDLLSRTGGQEDDAEDTDIDDVVEDDSDSASSGSRVRLKTWNQRHRKTLGLDADAKPAPLIDEIHRLMHLWKAGDVVKVDEYLNARALRSNRVFAQLIQALIELAEMGSEERSILESLSNHVIARGLAYEDKQLPLNS
jgi:adenine-specific DNA methylase